MLLVRSLRLVAAVTLAAAQLLAAAPVVQARALSAADCCARRCHHDTRSMTAASHCCGLEQQAADQPGTLTVPARAPSPVAITLAPAVATIVLPARLAEHRPIARAGPLSRATCVLRL